MTDLAGHSLTVALGDQEVRLTVNCPHASWSSTGIHPDDYPGCRKDPDEPWLDHGQCLLAELVTELGAEALLPGTSVPHAVATVPIRGWWNSPTELAIAPVPTGTTSHVAVLESVLRQAVEDRHAAQMQRCPTGCGCRRQTDDPDARDCACDGPCTTDETWWDGADDTQHFARMLATAGIPVPHPRTVEGGCPMGCGETLVLADTGRVECSSMLCPQPDALASLLADSETEHVVTFGAVGFTIRHPLRERITGDLESCALHQYCAAMTNPPSPGRYRAERDQVEGGWSFTLMEAPA